MTIRVSTCFLRERARSGATMASTMAAMSASSKTALVLASVWAACRRTATSRCRGGASSGSNRPAEESVGGVRVEIVVVRHHPIHPRRRRWCYRSVEFLAQLLERSMLDHAYRHRAFADDGRHLFDGEPCDHAQQHHFGLVGAEELGDPVAPPPGCRSRGRHLLDEIVALMDHARRGPRHRTDHVAPPRGLRRALTFNMRRRAIVNTNARKFCPRCRRSSRARARLRARFARRCPRLLAARAHVGTQDRRLQAIGRGARQPSRRPLGRRSAPERTRHRAGQSSAVTSISATVANVSRPRDTCPSDGPRHDRFDDRAAPALGDRLEHVSWERTSARRSR